MASDLKDLEKRLNSDTGLRDKFVKNPASLLRAEGFSLSADQSKELASAISKVSIPKPPPAGQKAARIKIIIKIGIGIAKD